jgi:hypothetical protein
VKHLLNANHAPGTIVADFETLLDACRHGLKITDSGLLPLRTLHTLNASLSHPAQTGLSRPQLRSLPPLQGLYLILHASGLVVLDTSRIPTTLVIDPPVHEQWNRLNMVERYGALLESWLLRGFPDILDKNNPSPFTDETRLGDLPLNQGARLSFLYDFGDQWLFHLTLKRMIEPDNASTSKPHGNRITLTEKHGKPPRQYEF